MAITLKPNGLASTGVARATEEPAGTTGAFLYVNSATGSDSNDGTREEAPKATVFGASGAFSVATTAVCDIISVAAGHTETISSAQTWNIADVTLLGLGSGSTRPRFTSAVAGVAITITGARTVFDNLYFPASTAATTARISHSGTGIAVRNCHFDCGANDTADTVLLGAAVEALFDSCSWAVTASGAARGLLCNAAATGLKLWNLTFSGGSAGWSGNAGAITAAALGAEIFNLTLSNYSDFKVTHASAKVRYFGVVADSTSSYVPAT